MALADFCTVSEVKQFLPIRATTTIDDGLLQRLVTAVSAAFRTVMNRDILSAPYVEERDGTGTNVLVFANAPVTLVSAVSIGAPLHRTDLTYGTDYVWTPTAVKLLSANFPKGVANVGLAYVAGYTTVPADLSEKAAKVAALRYKQLERLGQVSKTQGGETVTFDVSDFPADVTSILQQYTKVAQVL